jgi:integrase
MPRRKTLTELQVRKLPRRPKRYSISDPVQPGLVLRVPPQGPVQFHAVAWRGGKAKWHSVGTTATASLSEARALARDACRKIIAGQPLTAPSLHSVADAANKWLKLKVETDGQITASEQKRIVAKYVVPHLGDQVFVDLRRSTVAEWLDLLVEKHGAPQADCALRVLSAVCHWHETRDDSYRSPLIRGMRRSATVPRSRIFSDDELRIFWCTADAGGSLGACLQFALLTGQRIGKIQSLRWDEIDADGIWHVRREKREKGVGGALKLPATALALIRRQPRFVSNDRVFHGLSSRQIAAFREACELEPWVVHDLRRCWRSLASRCGVPREVSERVLGHTVGSAVEQTYDRHDFLAEKGQALARVAALIERIVAPQPNIVPLGAAS